MISSLSGRNQSSTHSLNRLAGWTALFSILMMVGTTGCAAVDAEEEGGEDGTDALEDTLTLAQKKDVCDHIKAVAGERGITNPLLFAGVPHHETYLVQCWKDATFHCKGPHSNYCGGPVLAGSGDGPCANKQGGLGMYQFDAGTHSQTLASYGKDILDIDGNIDEGVKLILHKVRVCPNMPDFKSDAAAIAWLNEATPGTQDFEEFLTAMAWCYNGCGPKCSLHQQRREAYRKGATSLLSALGNDYWYGNAEHYAPGVASWGENRLDTFITGTDGKLRHKWWNGKWSSWEVLGGTLTSAPAAVSTEAHTLDIFARGGENKLYHKQWDGQAWSSWVSLGGKLTSAPSAASMAPGRIDVFARGAGNELYQKWRKDGVWSSWVSLGGNLKSAPTVVSMAPNRLDIFARGTDNKLYQKSWTGAWSSWLPLEGDLSSAPAAVSMAPDRIDIFARGADNQLYQKSWTGAWSSWEALGGTLTSAPTAASMGPNRLDVFARGEDGQLSYKAWQDGKWQDWSSLGGALK